MVYKAKYEIPKDYTIYSNFKLDLPNYKELTLDEILNPPENEKCVFFVDEIYNLLESRTSGRTLNRESSYTINFQKRKHGLNTYGTSPIKSPIDKRFRIVSNFDIYTEPRIERLKQDFIYHIFDKRKKLYYIDVIKYAFAKKHLFPIFNTREVIKSYNSGSTEFNIASQNEKMFKKVLYRKYNIVVNNSNHLKDITHDSLTTTLIDLEIYLKWEKYIYQLIKRNYPK